MRSFLTGFALLASAVAAPAQRGQQQVADRKADVTVDYPAYVRDEGPLVLIDAAHHNPQTIATRFGPAAMVLRNDGFQVRGLRDAATAAALAAAKVLVIANAHAAPTGTEGASRSAFTADEIVAIHAWVENGGSLMLIADHMPNSSAADALARSFGFSFEDSFALLRDRGGLERFASHGGQLVEGPITRGDAKGKPVSVVYCFTGTVLHAPAGATPLLRLGKGNYRIVMPKVPWQFEGQPYRWSTDDDLRGAAMEIGKGRVALFSEAAMFTAQRVGNDRMGFNAPEAHQNKQYLLNVVQWLARTQ